MDKRTYLLESFSKFGYELTDKQADQFLTYEKLLVEWNQKMNLTAITDFEEIVWKHFIDSTAVLQSEYVSRETWNGSMIDVGTGAGFPGIPLKIIFPNLKVTLLDSLNKRIAFLDEVIRVCGLEKIDTIHGRAEDMAHNEKYRERYDLCVSRAVANLSTLSEYCIPFIRKGGKFISYKSADIKEELNNSKKAIKIFGGECKMVENFIINGTDLPRSLVIITKVDNTPKKYPRKAGTPSKSPIC
ncbi:MAG: 16S rRNA (guanine(527)-N(7))-methyltransferase RsmG [Clostridiales bacterium]|nr:16S rRNA (guanine(527)-N(7))-methyltransferase RsmG [Clostridiales bacterium]